MSMSEIADNKWESSAAKPPVATGIGAAQMVMFIGLTVFFFWMFGSVVYAIVGPQQTKLYEKYEKMDSKEAEEEREAKSAAEQK